MKEKAKKVIVVPYPMNNNGPLVGDPSGSYVGIPIFPLENSAADENDL